MLHVNNRFTKLLYGLSALGLLAAVIILPTSPALADSGATSAVRIIKYDADGTTILDEKTVDYQWMKDNLPVQGDGTTHYYHQGPVFEGDMWDPQETTNLKDKGAVMGTDVKDLCDLVGGMAAGDQLSLAAIDGYHIEFAYENVYHALAKQGPIAICWYQGDTGTESSLGVGYPGKDTYYDALQIVIMAKATNPQGQHVFGNDDMRICMPQEEYQHFYQGYASSNGLSGKWINEVRIFTGAVPVPEPESHGTAADETPFPILPVALGGAGLVIGGIGAWYWLSRRPSR